MAHVFSLREIIEQLQTNWADGSTAPRDWLGTTVEYAFLDPILTVPFDEWAGLTAMTGNQQGWAEEAFELWDDLIAINLTNTTNEGIGQINFAYSSTTDDGGTYAKMGTVPLLGIITDATIWMNTEWVNLQNDNIGYGKSGFETYLHEIGHTLGLSHPGSYNAGDDPEPTYAANAEYFQDSNEYTVMSYFSAVETSPEIERFDSAGNYTYISTPLLHDIAAIQAKYGADLTTRSVDTVYGFNSSADRSVFNFQINKNPVIAIWDGGGIDTLDCSGFNQNQFIQLEAGSYSDIGALTKNVAIAFRCIIENAVGGIGDDMISGNFVNNLLSGGIGKDGLSGEFGNDTLLGGDGIDTIRGGDGNDTLNGGTGADELDGGKGHDVAVYDALIGEVIRIIPLAGMGNWTVIGAAQASGDALTRIEGFAFGNGSDMITIASAADMRYVTIDGNGGNDIITGSAYYEAMVGGTGSDFFRPNEGSFSVFGGTAGAVSGTWIESLDDNDQLFLDRRSFGANYSLLDNGISALGSWSGTDNSTARGIAVIRYLGSDFSDTVIGALRDDVLRGFGGVDTFNGRSGNDELDGGDGADNLTGGEGADLLIGGLGDDYLEGGEQDDRLQGGLGWDFLDGGNGNDRIETGGGGDIRVYGGAGNDELIGSDDGETMNGGSEHDTMRGFAGNDILYGDAGNDVILAGDGNDYIDPGLGAETIDGGGGYDVLTIHRETTTDGVTFSLNGAVGSDGTSTIKIEELFYWAGGGGDRITGGAGANNIWGGAGNDVLTGGASSDFLSGGDNDDTLRGGRGVDVFEAGAGNDRIETGGGGDQQVFGEAGNDLMIGSSEVEILQGGSGNDTLRAVGGNDQLWGDAGADVLAGGVGNDTLNGGLDSDTFVFSRGTGSDLIMDFDSAAAGGQDIIDVTAFDFAGFAAMLTSGVTISSALGSTVINFGGGNPVVTLSSVDAGTIDATDFLF